MSSEDFYILDSHPTKYTDQSFLAWCRSRCGLSAEEVRSLRVERIMDLLQEWVHDLSWA